MTSENGDTPTFDDSPSKAKAGKVVGKDGKTYHKSASANATVAPTNQATIDNVTKSKGLSAEELDLVTSVHWWYGLKGELPSLEVLKNELFFTEEQLHNGINNPTCRAALEERGIKLTSKWLIELGHTPVNPDPKSPLTPLQLVVANMMMDLTDTRSDRKKLQDAGVKTSTYQMWLRDPAYKEYLRERAEGLVGDVQHEALLSLVDRVRSGDLSAIKYYHEFTGRFVEQKAAASSGGGSIGDLQRIIVSIVEIIVDEVDDPQVAARISDRLKGLITGNQLAGVLPTNEPDVIVQPEIAQNRVITPELQGLMERGLGYE